MPRVSAHPAFSSVLEVLNLRGNLIFPPCRKVFFIFKKVAGCHNLCTSRRRSSRETSLGLARSFPRVRVVKTKMEKELHYTSCTRRSFPGCVNMGQKNCVLLPAIAKQYATFCPISHNLGRLFWCSPVFCPQTHLALRKQWGKRSNCRCPFALDHLQI